MRIILPSVAIILVGSFVFLMIWLAYLIEMVRP